MAITLGNDISKYQGDVNYDVFKDNTQFVIFKATEGNGYTDPKLNRNQSEARRVGLLLGYYHFARPDLGNTPEAEANYFLSKIGELKENELLALDYECKNQKQSDVTWCKKFLDIVFEKTKVRPFIYLNQAQIKNFDWAEVIGGSYALWVACYTYDPNKNTFVIGEFPSVAIQQWSNKQTVPGVAGGVDGNVFFGTLDTLKKYGYHAPVVVPVVTPPVVVPPVVTPSELEVLKELNIKLNKENTDLEIQVVKLVKSIDELNVNYIAKDKEVVNLQKTLDVANTTISEQTLKIEELDRKAKDNWNLYYKKCDEFNAYKNSEKEQIKAEVVNSMTTKELFILIVKNLSKIGK